MSLVPAETPVTSPDEFTVAIPGVAEAHGLIEAAVTEPVNAVVDSTHTLNVPEIVGSTLSVVANAAEVYEQPLLLITVTV